MTALKERIIRLIEATGPISVVDYMARCLFDPQHGYYTTREPFGRAGDFTTAPEVSQMFGELIGAWLVLVWRGLGRPDKPLIAEIGPGRGTLAKDIARTIGRLDPALRGASSFHLIETSPRLTEVQAATLQDAGNSFAWVESISQLPQGRPLLIVGNELFDAIPVRQFVKTPNGWRERCVTLDDAGELAFTVGVGSLDPGLLLQDARQAPEGSIFETAPARTALMQEIAERIARDGGGGLFFDYGHLTPGMGDTLQAILKHAYDDPLAHPGEADLTSHVDFSALAGAIRQAGLTPHLTTQGDFLLANGLLERAGKLGANADEAARMRITSEVERLASPQEMGKLFKVLGFATAMAELPGFARS